MQTGSGLHGIHDGQQLVQFLLMLLSHNTTITTFDNVLQYATSTMVLQLYCNLQVGMQNFKRQL